MKLYQFLRTLNARIKNLHESIDVYSSRYNFNDSRYSSPISNPFFNSKKRTLIWIDEIKK